MTRMAKSQGKGHSEEVQDFTGYALDCSCWVFRSTPLPVLQHYIVCLLKGCLMLSANKCWQHCSWLTLWVRSMALCRLIYSLWVISPLDFFKRLIVIAELLLVLSTTYPRACFIENTLNLRFWARIKEVEKIHSIIQSSNTLLPSETGSPWLSWDLLHRPGRLQTHRDLPASASRVTNQNQNLLCRDLSWPSLSLKWGWNVATNKTSKNICLHWAKFHQKKKQDNLTE